MENLTSELASEMYWLQPKIGKEYFELQAASGVLETLRCNRALFFEAVTVCSSFGEWVFKSEGFSSKIVITLKDKNTEIATYSQKFLDYGRLKFANGNEFIRKIEGFWARKTGFADETGAMLFLMYLGAPKKKFSDIFRQQGTIEMLREGYHHQGEELSILLALGWYLMILDVRSDVPTT